MIDLPALIAAQSISLGNAGVMLVDSSQKNSHVNQSSPSQLRPQLQPQGK